MSRPRGEIFVGGAVGLTLALGVVACVMAPPEAGYELEGPRAGPTRAAPEGFRWELDGPCRLEPRRNVYNAGWVQDDEVCDWVLRPEASACGSDADCKGDRICEAGRCAEPTAKPR